MVILTNLPGYALSVLNISEWLACNFGLFQTIVINN